MRHCTVCGTKDIVVYVHDPVLGKPGVLTPLPVIPPEFGGNHLYYALCSGLGAIAVANNQV